MMKLLRGLRKSAFWLFVSCFVAWPAAAHDRMTTVIGGGPSGIPGSAVNLSGPGPLAIDAQGNLYILSDKVYKLNRAGIITIVAGDGSGGFYGGDGGPAVKAQLNSPTSIAVDGSIPANVYIADFGNCVVRKVDQSTGIITTVVGLSADSQSARCGYSGDGGPANAAQLKFPLAVAVDPSTGDLYVGDRNFVVRKVAGGTALGTISTVAGIASNFCSNPSVSTQGAAATSVHICPPTTLTVDNSVEPANLFIGSGCNIDEVVGSTGKIYLVAGQPFQCGFTDNVIATQAQFQTISQMHVSVSGSVTTVQVADEYNGLIRQFTLTYAGGIPVPGVITTIAGTTRGPCGTGVLGTCIRPTGLAYAANGDYYISNAFAGGVSKVTIRNNTLSTAIGWYPFVPSTSVPAYSDPVGIEDQRVKVALLDPYAVFADPTSTKVYVGGGQGGAVYVWDSATNRISNFAGNGLNGLAGDGGPANAPTTQLAFPAGMAKDKKGDIYIADASNCRIRVVNARSGEINTFAGGACGFADGGSLSGAQFNFPLAIAFDHKENMYVADLLNCAIRKIDAQTAMVSTVALVPTPYCGYYGDGSHDNQCVVDPINKPTGVTVDGAGNVYFIDAFNNNIDEILARNGKIVTVAGVGSAGYNGDGEAVSSALNGPSWVTSDANGNLFITDQCNQLVRWVTPSGQMITFGGFIFAGIPTPGFYADDGPALEAELNYPVGITQDGDGNFYIADQSNQRIRRISAFSGFGLSATSLNFGSKAVGTQSGARTIKLSAIGPTKIGVIKVSKGFTETDDCAGTILSTGQTCKIHISFKPTADGPVTGTLTIRSNAFFASNPNAVSLAGTGTGSAPAPKASH